MKTDRELLELAAKAAGIKGKHPDDEDAGLFLAIEPLYSAGSWTYWNPLADDGDALRLAVKVGAWPIRGRVIPGDWSESNFIRVVINGVRFDEVFTDDPCAAVRRAIVRAAAAIGGGMP